MPFDDFAAWGTNLESQDAWRDGVNGEPALLRDRTRLRARLEAIIDRPEVREAIFIASPDLDDAIAAWRSDPDSRKGLRAERSLVRYVARMSGRATPFGLFAGHSVGSGGERTMLCLDPKARWKRHVRLDMDYVAALVDALAASPALRSELTYHSNTGTYQVSGQLHYAESRANGELRRYDLVTVEASDYLVDVLRRAAHGGVTVAQLASMLASDEISGEEAEAYVLELIDAQLLVPDIEPTASGEEPLDRLLARLMTTAAARDVTSVLESTRDALGSLAQEPLGSDPVVYRAVADRLRALPVPVRLKHLVQVDLVKSSSAATLGKEVLEEIARAVDLLHGLRPEPHQEDLAKFRRAFVDRYDRREMPLPEVLDEEEGIGFGTPQSSMSDISSLLESLALPAIEPAGERQPSTALDRLLIRRLVENENRYVLDLSYEELHDAKAGNGERLPLPDSLAVICSVAAESQSALDAGEFRVLMPIVAGPPGTALLGRFCHGDAELSAKVAGEIAAEESSRPDAIFAEIVHLPEGRVGNVILRPRFRRYEIPYLGLSVAEPDHQIPVTDLLVSIRNDHIVLRSAKLNREVLPRLTNAHSFRRSSIAIYRFLGALQTERVSMSLMWSWGAFETLPFLPRLCVGRLVLSRARWNVSRPDLAAAVSSGWERYKAIQDWRASKRIPRHVLFAETDNKLPVDLENPLSIDSFVDAARSKEQCRIEELFPAPHELTATDGARRYVSEVLVPLTVAQPTAEKPLVSTPRSSLARSFPPGSEWLFAKVYAGAATCDRVLVNVIAPLVASLARDRVIRRWFFIRYSDPDWHLRLRFHGDPGTLSEAMVRLRRACDVFLRDGAIRKIQFDTYERELERYGGGETMILSEAVFEADSDAALQVLAATASPEGAADRWQAAMYGMESYLNAFGFDARKKIALLSRSRRGFLDEMHAPRWYEHRLGERFRKFRPILSGIHDRRDEPRQQSHPWASAMRRHRKAVEALVADVMRAASSGGIDVEVLATSYMHMHVNRMLRSSQKLQEGILYDFLIRLLESDEARSRGST